MPRWLVHAFGGGLGHVTRALALTRQLVRRLPGDYLLLGNTPFAPAFEAEVRRTGLRVRWLPPEAGPAAAREWVAEVFANFQPDGLIVDTFPRGLGGELVPLLPGISPRRCVLISRGLPAAYLESYGLTEFVHRHYGLAIAPGEPSPFADALPVRTVRPFLVRDFEELLPIEAAATALATTPDRPVVLLVGSGTLAECEAIRERGQELARDWPEDWPPLRLALPPGIARPVVPVSPMVVAHYPLVECARAVRLVMGSAGSNLVAEARTLGITALYQPRPRRYDNQALRVAGERTVRENEAWLPRIAEALQAPVTDARPGANGAAEAAALIAESMAVGE